MKINKKFLIKVFLTALAVILQSGFVFAQQATTVEEGVLGVLEKARADEHELITLFFGEDLENADANRIADKVREAYPEQEIEVQDGGQPHYQFIVSIE